MSLKFKSIVEIEPKKKKKKENIDSIKYRYHAVHATILYKFLFLLILKVPNFIVMYVGLTNIERF